MELLDNKLVLNGDIDIKPITWLHTEVVQRLGGSNEDFIISKKNSRIHSKRISKEARLFLDEFLDPSSFINAVVNYSGKFDVDPDSLLTEVYPLVKTFINYGFVEYYAETKIVPKKQLFNEGDAVQGYKIVSCIQFLDDTESYKATDTKGILVFLKVIHNKSGELPRDLKNEISIYHILNQNSCKYVPTLIDIIHHTSYSLIVLEWIEGRSLWEIIGNNSIGHSEKLTVARSIIEAYNEFNANNILHADIHPHNFKVLESYEVKVLDFGSSVNLLDKNTTDQMRVGIISYYEPELAHSLLNNKPHASSSTFGEQYQLAALVYHVITGNTYISLSLETDIALKQIITDPPKPFADFFMDGKKLERVLMKSLQKNPSDRYNSWTDFYSEAKTALAEPIIAITKSQQKSSEVIAPIFEQFINSFVEEYGFDSDKTASCGINQPYCSLFHGATGIAYTYYRLALIKKDPELLSLAEIWINNAKQSSCVNGAFNNSEIGMESSTVGEHSVFHNTPGLLLVKALIENAQDNDALLDETLKEFITLAEQVSLSNENTFLLDPSQGPASIILAASILQSICKEKKLNKRLGDIQQKIIGAVMPAVHKDLVSDQPFQRNKFLGFAHGYAGLLYAAMQLKRNMTGEHAMMIQDSLRILDSIKTTDGTGVYWPVASDDVTVWTGWCHGVAGHILLWSTAYKLFSNDAYLKNATRAGEYLWKSYKNSTVTTICCGLAGQSLAFYKLGQVTNDKKWFDRGLHLAKCAVTAFRTYNLKDSLFQGKVGLALLSGESIDPASATWPICD